jgi:hypothetical protein
MNTLGSQVGNSRFLVSVDFKFHPSGMFYHVPDIISNSFATSVLQRKSLFRRGYQQHPY